MRPVLLAIARHAVEKFSAFFRRFNADAEDLNFSFEIALPLVDKGRHLGPAPRSPAAAVKENYRRRRLREHGGKFDGCPIDVFELYRGKSIAYC